jgi:hypothetical protein
MSQRLGTVLVLLASLGLACGGSDDDGGTNFEGSCEDDGHLCATIEVPSTFSGTPVKIRLALYNTLPPAGPPVAYADFPDPALASGMPFEANASEFTGVFGAYEGGDFMLYVLVDMNGADGMIPVSKVDYEGMNNQKLSLGPTKPGVHAGTITTALKP